MAVKPENAYIARVKRVLHAGVYAEKTNNPYRGGTPDMYYEGDRAALWVEYKWYPKTPDTINLCDTKSKPCLSYLQQQWLRRSHANGRRVAVVVGTPDGGIILPGLSWSVPQPVVSGNLLPPKEVAQWLTRQTMKMNS